MDISYDLLVKYNKQGPRYTSYPPATFFNEAYTADNFIRDIKDSNSAEPQNISLYVHIPFCPRLCHFCGCTTQKYGNQNIVDSYVDALKKEIKIIAAHIDSKRIVTQIHWGGGTPNSLGINTIQSIMDVFYGEFTFSEKAEIAIECNPAYLTYEYIDGLKKAGFNRMSIGIQDFNLSVLKNINREASKIPINDVKSYAKRIGFTSINFDFVYGLPGQTAQSFLDSIQKAIEIKPDRIVTFSYAHIPWVKPAQKIFEKIGMPSPDQKIRMLEESYKLLTKNGYTSLGIDHYALPEDELARALKNKKLHRNFQGYCTKETTGQVYAFGVSSISQLEGAYAQNTKDTGKYIDKINNNELPIERGYRLRSEEKIIRTVINEIMCNQYADFENIALHYKISSTQLLKICNVTQEALAPLINDGLIQIKGNTLTVKPRGFYFIRNIAMEFDPQLNTEANTYSKTV